MPRRVAATVALVLVLVLLLLVLLPPSGDGGDEAGEAGAQGERDAGKDEEEGKEGGGAQRPRGGVLRGGALAGNLHFMMPLPRGGRTRGRGRL